MDILMNDNYEYMYNMEVLTQAYEESYIASQMQNIIFNEGAGKTSWASFTSFLTYVKERIMAFFEYMKKLIKKVKNYFTTKYIVNKALKMNLEDKDVEIYNLKDLIYTMKEVEDDLSTYGWGIINQIDTNFQNAIQISMYFDPEKFFDKGLRGNPEFLKTTGHTSFVVNSAKMLSKYGVSSFNDMKEGIMNYAENQKSLTKCSKDVIKEISEYDRALNVIIEKVEKDIDKAEKGLSKLKRADKIATTALDGKLQERSFEKMKDYFNALLNNLEDYRKWMTALLGSVTSVRTLNIKSLSSLVKNNKSDNKKEDDK